MIGKTTVLVIRIHKQVKSIVFAVSMKFCDESGLAIFNFLSTFLQNAVYKEMFILVIAKYLFHVQ